MLHALKSTHKTMATYTLPDGQTISDSMPFILYDVSYPSNWLLLSTDSDRESLGIEGPVSDPPWYDQMFYYGPNQPKEHSQLQEEYVGHVKRNANSMLSPTDWMIIRSAEPNGKPVSQAVLDERSAIRQLSNIKEAAIKATGNTDELAAYITSPAYSDWSQQ